MKLKKCKKCGKELPPTMFYRHPAMKDGRHSACKECLKAYARQQNSSSKHSVLESGNETEQWVVNHLLRMGIYAISGKASQFYYVDIVCWGCVRLEVKASNLTKQGYCFRFTPRQQRLGVDADLVVLVPIGYKPSVFPASFSAFYHNTGKLKTGFKWTPGASSHPPSGFSIMTDAIMEQYRERWGLIEEVRQQIISDLLTYGDISTKTASSVHPQLNLL
jgi:hypothetical protein